MDDPAALAALNAQGGSLDEALQIVAPQTGPDWVEPLNRAIKALNVVPISDLETLDDEHRAIIGDLVLLAEKRLKQADSFRS